MSLSTIALHRFGLGARPDDRPPADPKRWLIDQIAQYEPRPAALRNAPTSAAAAATLADYYQEQQAMRQERRDTTPEPATPGP